MRDKFFSKYILFPNIKTTTIITFHINIFNVDRSGFVFRVSAIRYGPHIVRSFTLSSVVLIVSNSFLTTMAGEQQEYIWPMSGNDGPDVEWEHVPIPGPIPPPPPVKEGKLPRVECILECIQLGGIKDEKGALPQDPNGRIDVLCKVNFFISFFILYS